MTTTEVLDRFAQAFGQDPMLRPHGRYQCGGCGGWFGVGDVSVVLWPGGGQFRCGLVQRPGKRGGAGRRRAA